MLQPTGHATPRPETKPHGGSSARHLRENFGRACTKCAKTEARCAWIGRCCPSCTHFRHLDSNGNEKQKPADVIRIDNRPVCDTCGRQVTSRGRFDCPGLCAVVRRAYDRSRKRAS